MLVQLDARGLFSTIFRQVWKFLAVFVPVVLIAFIYAVGATPAYQSTAKLLVRFGQDARPDMPISGPAGGLSAEEKRGLVQSNVNILLSRDLAEALIKEVSLEKAYPEIARGGGDTQKKITYAAERLIQNDIVTRTESGAGIIEVSLFNREPEVAKDLLERLVTLFVERQSEIYGNPQADVIRAQADAAYKKLEVSTKELFKYKTQVGVASIDEEISLLLKKRSDIAEYMSRNDHVGDMMDIMPSARPIVPLYESQIDPELLKTQVAQNPETIDPVQAHAEAVGADTIIPEAADPAMADAPLPPEVVRPEPPAPTILPAKMGATGSESPFPALDEIQKRIDEMRAKEISMRQTYREDSEIILNLRENIAAETEVLNNSVMALRDKLTELDARIVQMNEYKSVYDSLARQAEFDEESYKTAKERLQAAEVNSDLNQRKITQISVLEQPVMPEGAAKPRRMMIILLAMIIGAAFGVAVCLVSELLDQRFFTPEQVQASLKEPLLASFSLKVPDHSGNLVTPTYIEQSLTDLYVRLPAEVIEKAPALKKFAPAPAVSGTGPLLSARSMANLYQSISAKMQPGVEKKVFLVASSYQGEGATTIAWEFARYAAEVLKQKVLFIDSRGQEGRATLLDLVRGQSTAGQVISKVSGLDADIQVAGLAAPDQSNLVLANMDQLSRTLDTLKDVFDMIVISASNVLGSPAHVGLGKLANGTVFIVEASRTRMPVAQKALEVLANAGARVIGTVLNKRIYYIPKWLYQRL